MSKYWEAMRIRREKIFDLVVNQGRKPSKVASMFRMTPQQVNSILRRQEKHVKSGGPIADQVVPKTAEGIPAAKRNGSV